MESKVIRDSHRQRDLHLTTFKRDRKRWCRARCPEDVVHAAKMGERRIPHSPAVAEDDDEASDPLATPLKKDLPGEGKVATVPRPPPRDENDESEPSPRAREVSLEDMVTQKGVRRWRGEPSSRSRTGTRSVDEGDKTRSRSSSRPRPASSSSRTRSRPWPAPSPSTPRSAPSTSRRTTSGRPSAWTARPRSRASRGRGRASSSAPPEHAPATAGQGRERSADESETPCVSVASIPAP